MSFFEELKRRNVIKVAIAYVVVAWLVMQVADVVLNNIEAPDWVFQAIMLVLGIGFALALFFAWAFEMTPEGLKKEKDVDRSQSITHKTGRKLDFLIIGVLVLALGYFVNESRFASQKGSEPFSETTASQSSSGEDQKRALTPIDNSIAVLPFANRSNQADDLFFTDGIHDDLLTQLAKISDLKVISRTSVMEYRDTTKKISEIAEELGVSKILEGGVQRAGKRIRINAQLIDVATDRHLWAETFDREMTMDNIFDIQTEITRQIVTAVKGELTPQEQRSIEQRSTDSLEAWEAYLHARAGTNRADYSAVKYIEAEPWARRAVELDPGFAQAWALLAEINAQFVWIGYDDSQERRDEVRRTLQHAVELAPENATVKAAQADYLYRIKVDYPGAQKLYQEALALAPGDARILLFRAITERRLGLWEQSIASFERSLDLDPANVFTGSQMIDTLAQMNEWQHVERLADQWMLRYPESGDLIGYKVRARMFGYGDLKGAREIFDLVPPSASNVFYGINNTLSRLELDYERWIKSFENPEIMEFGIRFFNTSDLFMGMAHSLAGNNEEARWHLQKHIREVQDIELIGPIANGFRKSTIGTAYALLGDMDSALAAMDEAVKLMPREKDHLFGANIERQQTLVMAMAGLRDKALERLAADIDAPEGFSRWELHLDPAWDFFRDDERFNALARPLNLDEARR